jgi:hypothetical protein
MFTDSARAAQPATLVVRLGRAVVAGAATLALLPGVAFSCPCADARCLPMCSENVVTNLAGETPPIIRG